MASLQHLAGDFFMAHTPLLFSQSQYPNKLPLPWMHRMVESLLQKVSQRLPPSPLRSLSMRETNLQCLFPLCLMLW